MNDILFGNNNTAVIKRLSKRYFKKNRVRNIAAILAILLTAFLFTSITSLAFSMVSSIQLSQQMLKGSKADGDIRYMTEEQYEQLISSDFVEQAGCRRVIGFATNSPGHSVEIDYADAIQQELTFCVPTHGDAPQAANEISTSDLALEALGVEAEIGAQVPVEFELRGQTYHFDMVLSGWWEASNDTVSLMIVSENFVEENPDLFRNTFAEDREMAGTYMSDVVLKNKTDVKGQLQEFARSVGGNTDDMSASNYILCAENEVIVQSIDPLMLVAVVGFVLLFMACGYLLIYNIFDISVMQDVQQYGLLRTIGCSTRQIKKLVNRQAVWLTVIGLPIGLLAGFLISWVLLPVVTQFLRSNALNATEVSVSPLIFVIAALFTILTVFISIRKPAKKAAKVSPLEAIRYTGQDNIKKKATKRTQGAKLPRMALANLGRSKRRTVFIVISMLLCIVLLNSAFVITQSMDENKWISRQTKTDYTIYNSTAVNQAEPFQYHKDGLSLSVPELINQQDGVENGRYLYRNTLDDTDVTVNYGIENFTMEGTDEWNGRTFAYDAKARVAIAPDAGNQWYGNVFGVSDAFWDDITIYDGEKNIDTLKQKMYTGEYVIIGYNTDKLTGEPYFGAFGEQFQMGDILSFYKNGELVKTCTVLAIANMTPYEYETSSGALAASRIGGDAPFIYMTDEMFGQLYDNPTLFSYGFNVADDYEQQIDGFLNDFTSNNSSVSYTSTALMKQQLVSVGNIVLLVGGMIGVIMAFAGLINFTNMMITNIITRRHEFATMQSIGMTNRQLRRMMIYEGIYYAGAADIVGAIFAAIVGLTVLKSVLNSSAMWYFTLHFTLVPALIIALVYLLLAAVIPVIVLRFFNKGTVVERLRISE